MTETLTMTTERLDDMPLWLAQRERMGVQPRRDEHFPAHGNGVGLSLGWVTVVWLTPILSQADHRLNHVEPWAEKRCHTLRGCTGRRVHPLDVSDDRLAAVLEALSDEARWGAFERALTRQRRRGYDLLPARVRLESTTASGDWAVTAEGRCQCGPSQDHRPDLPQVKVLVSALDPLGWPVATAIVPGPRADAPLDVPAITRVREGVGRHGLWYVGDGQMGALETRAFLQAGGDDSWCPLSESQLPTAVLAAYLDPIWRGQQRLIPLDRADANGTREGIADGDERRQPLTAVVTGQPMSWTERRRVVRSLPQVQRGETALRARLAQAQAALAARHERRQGKRRLTQLTALREAVAAILRRYQVQALRRVRVEARVGERLVRRSGSRPATVRVEREAHVTARVDQQAVEAAVRRLGGRVYATTQPTAQRSLAQAVLTYRRESLVERDVGRLKGQPLSLTPRYLERDAHATGLIRVLAVGWRVLTRLEFVVRRRLTTARTGLVELDAGHPKRATARPTAERLLERFQELPLTILRERRRRRDHLTPLSTWHERLLARLDFPVAIDTRRCADVRKPP